MRKYILFRPQFHNDPSETNFFALKNVRNSSQMRYKKKFLGFLTWKRSCLICFHAWLQLDCVHNANGPSLSSYINLTIFRYVLLLPNWKWDHFRTEQMAVTTRQVVGPSLSPDRFLWKAQAREGPEPDIWRKARKFQLFNCCGQEMSWPKTQHSWKGSSPGPVFLTLSP